MRPDPDEIVSRVTFGFWPLVLGSIDPNRSDKIFPIIFPHHPLNAAPLQWKNPGQKRAAITFVHELKNFRNHIAHHEPLWKFPAVGGLHASNSAADSLQRFSRLLSLFDDAIGFISNDLRSDLQATR